MEMFVSYILTAILSWCPPASFYVPYGETETEATARLREIAEDIVEVAFDEAEPPVFAGDTGRLRTALLQAAIASKETSFQRFVGDGSCNRRGYQADRRGNCDGGTAFSFWQIHIFGGGYVLMPDGSLSSRQYAGDFLKDHPEAVLTGADLIADRKKAVRIAQRIERQSLRVYHSLCAFSGEPCEGGRHPKASARLDRAIEYWNAHPMNDTIRLASK
jgi:hypothetical protein